MPLWTAGKIALNWIIMAIISGFWSPGIEVVTVGVFWYK